MVVVVFLFFLSSLVSTESHVKLNYDIFDVFVEKIIFFFVSLTNVYETVCSGIRRDCEWSAPPADQGPSIHPLSSPLICKGSRHSVIGSVHPGQVAHPLQVQRNTISLIIQFYIIRQHY